ncbi:hypothetical protein KC356_g61 [Hortaea werneckii]|nr:hypothetical protein KC356_g61 [Hortaea werneckii]
MKCFLKTRTTSIPTDVEQDVLNGCHRGSACGQEEYFFRPSTTQPLLRLLQGQVGGGSGNKKFWVGRRTAPSQQRGVVWNSGDGRFEW